MKNKKKYYNKKNLYIYNTPWFLPLEKLHVKFLKCFRRQDKYPLLSLKVFKNNINKIVKGAYENGSPTIDEVNKNIRILNYCSAIDMHQIYYFLTDQCFILITSYYNCYYIVEFAAMDGKCKDPILVFDYVLKNFNRKPFIANCNISDSYPLITALARFGRIKIINDSFDKENDAHFVKFRVVKQKKHKRKKRRKK